MERKRRPKKAKKDENPFKDLKPYEWQDPEYFAEIDILSLLPTKKLREIEKDFPDKSGQEGGDDGLTLLDFLITMHQHLNLNLEKIKENESGGRGAGVRRARGRDRGL